MGVIKYRRFRSISKLCGAYQREFTFFLSYVGTVKNDDDYNDKNRNRKIHGKLWFRFKQVGDCSKLGIFIDNRTNTSSVRQWFTSVLKPSFSLNLSVRIMTI